MNLLWLIFPIMLAALNFISMPLEPEEYKCPGILWKIITSAMFGKLILNYFCLYHITKNIQKFWHSTSTARKFINSQTNWISSMRNFICKAPFLVVFVFMMTSKMRKMRVHTFLSKIHHLPSLLLWANKIQWGKNTTIFKVSFYWKDTYTRKIILSMTDIWGLCKNEKYTCKFWSIWVRILTTIFWTTL